MGAVVSPQNTTVTRAGRTVLFRRSTMDRIVTIGDKDPEYVARQGDELTTNSGLVGLELCAHQHKASLGFSVPKFETEFAY